MEDDTPETAAVNVSSNRTSINKNYKKNKKNPPNPFQSDLLEQLKNKQEMASNHDMSLVMSLIPYLKLLNDEQKLDFHLNSLQYLKHVIKHKSPPSQFDQ